MDRISADKLNRDTIKKIFAETKEKILVSAATIISPSQHAAK